MIIMEGVNSTMTKAKLRVKLEEDFVKRILKIGINNMSRVREDNDWCYRFELKNGDIRYWINLSKESLEKLGFG